MNNLPGALDLVNGFYDALGLDTPVKAECAAEVLRRLKLLRSIADDKAIRILLSRPFCVVELLRKTPANEFKEYLANHLAIVNSYPEFVSTHADI